MSRGMVERKLRYLRQEDSTGGIQDCHRAKVPVLYMNLMEHDPTKMFYYKFEARLVPRTGPGTMGANDPSLLGSHGGMGTLGAAQHSASQPHTASGYPSQNTM